MPANINAFSAANSSSSYTAGMRLSEPIEREAACTKERQHL
jgi:hypothetical protein